MVEQLIDDQTTILAYKTYTEISMKKDMIKQRNRLFASILKEMTAEIAKDALNEAQKSISGEKSSPKDSNYDSAQHLRANTLDMPTNIVDDFSGEGSSKQENKKLDQNGDDADEQDDAHRTTVIDLSSDDQDDQIKQIDNTADDGLQLL